MTPEQFRRLALRCAGAVEGEHMGHPDFRADGRIFASLHPDGAQGMVKLTPAGQRRLLRADPATYSAAPGAWGRQGCTMVRLAGAKPAEVRAALAAARRRARPR